MTGHRHKFLSFFLKKIVGGIEFLISFSKKLAVTVIENESEPLANCYPRCRTVV